MARVRNQSPLAPLFVFLETIKFEHSLFALPFAYLGLFLAEKGWPRASLLLWVTVAMISFRTYAMAMNRLIDREIDAQNPRTALRALPQKKLSVSFVVGAAAISIIIFLASTWMLGALCFSLAPLPILLAALYPYLKRFTWISHVVLGIILGMSTYGAWLASRSEFSWIPGLMMLGIAGWVAGFDILYSLQDYDFDRQAGLYSVPVRFGRERALTVARVLHGMAFLVWMVGGILAGLGWIYGLGLGIVSLFLIREHWLIHRFGMEKINQAFFSMNVGVSFVVFIATVADLLLNHTQ